MVLDQASQNCELALFMHFDARLCAQELHKDLHDERKWIAESPLQGMRRDVGFSAGVNLSSWVRCMR